MKHLVFTLLMLSLLIACDRNRGCEKCGTNYVSISVAGISAPLSRASGVAASDEEVVSSCRLYVFDKDGDLVDGAVYDIDSDSGRAGFYLVSGIYYFYAFANDAGLPAKPSDVEELLSSTIYLGDNGVGSFIMGGSLEECSVESDVDLVIHLKRYVSKFSYVIRNLAKDSSSVLKIDKIYLTNVAGTNDLSAGNVPSSDGLWFNKMKYEHHSDAIDSLLLVPESDLKLYMDYGDTLVTAHSLYAFPNNRPNIYGSTQWSARNTRLVVEGEFADRHWYYPVTIPVVERNRHYHVDLTVSGPGLADPEDPADKNTYVKVSVSVDDWEDGGTIGQIY